MMRIVIVDDHELVRRGLIQALAKAGFDQICEARSIAEARAQIAHFNPEVIVVDINLPDGSGFDLVLWVRALSEKIGIVVLTLHEDHNYVLAAMKAGASAYVCKSAPTEQLIAAIEHAGKSPLTFSANNLAQTISQTLTRFNLTAREFDVVALLEKGCTTQEIATTLFVSQATVKTHLASIYRKFEVTNRTAAVHIFRKSGLSSQ